MTTPIDEEALLDWLASRGWAQARRDAVGGRRWWAPPHGDGEVQVTGPGSESLAAEIAQAEGGLVSEVEAALDALRGMEEASGR